MAVSGSRSIEARACPVYLPAIASCHMAPHGLTPRPRGLAQHVLRLPCCCPRSKPWRWAGHVLGHEGPGSLAALLREAGLAQALTTGPFDEVGRWCCCGGVPWCWCGGGARVGAGVV